MAQTDNNATYRDSIESTFLPITIGVIIYPFHEAPKRFKELSTHGGDEDWVIVCGKEFRDTARYIADRLAVCDLEEHETDAVIVFITAHA